MSTNAAQPLTLNVRHARLKQQQAFDNEQFELQGSGSGYLSPNLQPPTPPTFPACRGPCNASLIGGKYILLDQIEGSALFHCVNIQTKEEYACKVVLNERFQECATGHYRLESVPQVNSLEEVLIGSTRTYMIFPKTYGDLHSYVRMKRRLREPEAVGLFSQIVAAVAACHDSGIILRDIKLRKFVFKDPERTELKLETMDDAVVLEEGKADILSDKHGCPAYVSPEILSTSGNYSGKAADCWSLGIMLYTMLVGRYPFHDTDPGVLLGKIRRGTFTIPDTLSSKAKCLIRNLLRKDPAERLMVEEVLDHPWFKQEFKQLDSKMNSAHGSLEHGYFGDQIVPDVVITDRDS